MSAKRVVHILPHTGGGGEVYVSALQSSPEFVHERFYLSAGRSPATAAASLPSRIPTLVRRVRNCDLVHVHGDAAAAITSPVLSTRPSVITTHGLHLLRRSSGPQLAIVRAALRRAAAVSRVVIATSTSELQELQPLVREQDRAKLRVIFNGVDSPAHRSGAEKRATRADLCIAPTTTLGVFAGELEPRKEPLLAIAAAKRVREDGLPFVLAVAGSGPLSAAVQASADDGIRVLGQVADLQPLLAAADVFLQPSSREGMSLALLEAMSQGLAVIAADTPGNAEAIADAGMTVATGDEAALADAVRRVVTHPELRLELGEHAKRRASEQFGIPRFVEETIAAYSSAIMSASSAKVAPT